MAFANSILAGTVLVRPAIQSPDYDPGVAGWQIAADGSAEFNDATFRGQLDGATGTFSGELSAATGTFAGDLDAAGGTFSGDVVIGAGPSIIIDADDGMALPVAGDFQTDSRSLRWYPAGNTGSTLGRVTNSAGITRVTGQTTSGIHSEMNVGPFEGVLRTNQIPGSSVGVSTTPGVGGALIMGRANPGGGPGVEITTFDGSHVLVAASGETRLRGDRVRVLDGNLEVTDYMRAGTSSGNPSWRIQRYGGTLNASGADAVPHGLGATAHRKLIGGWAYCEGNSGEALQMNLRYVDGGNFAVQSGIPGRGWRGALLYTQDAPAW